MKKNAGEELKRKFQIEKKLKGERWERLSTLPEHGES